MNQLVRWIEGMSSGGFAVGAAIVVGAPLAGTFAVTGLADLALVGLAMLAGGGTTWAVLYRRGLGLLPLEFAESALRGRLDGCAVYRFRIRLGRGRPMRNAHAEVAFVREDGTEVRLEPVADQVPVLLGPWTVAVLDATRQCDGAGAFRVRVRVQEGGRIWESERTWPRAMVREGRFEAAICRRRGRLVWDPVAWDAVLEEPAP
ncbi:MAG: hypothetical protein JRI25_24575 [Deltaproteobacteria bacterium]|nr:hypothetical protein [Deltaproteobacteria bacterium]MBW2257754.1 hypothetical protein [Deltaproteobacteria bacterium]